MEITNVKIRTVYGDPRIRAIAMLELDGSLIINDILVIDTGSKLIVQLPQTANAKRKGQESVVPLNNQLREQINKTVLSEYERNCNS